MCGMWDPSQPGESGVLENTEFDREIQIVIRSFEK